MAIKSVSLREGDGMRGVLESRIVATVYRHITTVKDSRIICTYHVPRTTYHVPRTTYHVPRTTNHEPRTTNHEPMKAWYLVFSKPNQEELAKENLERQCFPTYFPRMHCNRRRRGRYVKVVEAMFPRYLFVNLDNVTDNWSPIRSTVGVSTFVRFGEQIAQVPDDLVDQLHANEDEGGLQCFGPAELKPGDKVRVIEGVMAGYEAIVSAKTGKERVKILLNYAAQCTAVDISRNALELAV